MMTKFLTISIDICILLLTSMGFFISVILLLLVIYHQRRIPITTSILLSCNTYPAIIIGSLTMIDMFGHNLYGDLYENVSFNNWWCYVRFYLLLVSFSAIYQSFLLQAFYHLFRVVFARCKQLRNLRFMFLLIILQWSMSFLLMLPPLIFDHFEYLPNHYYCQIVFSNLYGLILTSFPIYYFPLLAIGLIYIYIIYYTRRKTRSMLIRRFHRRSNHRDLIVLRRITVLICLLWALTFPIMILWLVYIGTGYLYPLSYHLQWLTFAISLVVFPLASPFLTPQLRKFLNKIRAEWNHSNDGQTEIIINLRYSTRTQQWKCF